MRSLRAQLILSHILPFVIVMPLMGLVLLYLIEAQVLLQDLSHDLEERVSLIAAAVEDRPEVFANPQSAESFIAEISIAVDGDIFLLNDDGQLLASSGNPSEAPDPSQVVKELRVVTTAAPSVTIDYGLTGQEGEAYMPVVDINNELVGVVGVNKKLQGVAGSLTHLRRLVLLTILGGMLAGALLGYLLAERLARPIAESAEAVQDIANGRPVPPLPAEGPTEIRELSESVNVLSDRLRLLEQTRQRSLANIVHELGRPLGAIMAAVHVLRQPPGDDPAIRAELLAGVEQELDHMRPLLDDLATLHNEVVGRQTLQLRPVKVSEWLVAVLLPWRAVALEKGIDWSTDIPSDLPTLPLDPDRMAQVVGNVVGNAIKYSPVGERVAVAATSDTAELRITVTDTGPGVGPDEQALIFEPFYRGSQSKRFSEGLGLGLSIARGLVEAHGGRLELQSAPGQGSTFTIVLPLPTTAA